MSDSILIRPIERPDYAGWRPLWDGYNAFYGRVGETALPEEITSIGRRFLGALIVGCFLAGCQPRVALEGTPVSVAVPKGFERNTSMYTHNPSVYFRLPLPAAGFADVYPELSIEEKIDVPAPTSVRDFVAVAYRRTPKEFVIEPREMKVRGQRAVEMASRTVAIFDSVTPSGMTGTQIGFISHDIVFVHRQRYYVCSLTAYPDEYEKFAATVRSLCASVRFED